MPVLPVENTFYTCERAVSLISEGHALPLLPVENTFYTCVRAECINWLSEATTLWSLQLVVHTFTRPAGATFWLATSTCCGQIPFTPVPCEYGESPGLLSGRITYSLTW